MAKEIPPKDLNELMYWLEEEGFGSYAESIDFINDSIPQSVKKAVIKAVMEEWKNCMPPDDED